MITRYALFEGSIKNGQTEAFRAAVMQELLPKWKAFPGALEVSVSFAEFRDDGAPEFPLILAIDYADVAAVEAALISPARFAGKAATEALLPRFFPGRVHHHVTKAEAFPL